MNQALNNLAGAHALEMKQAGRLTHASPTTGTLTTRVRHRGLSQGWLPSLAEARDETEAFRAFLESQVMQETYSCEMTDLELCCGVILQSPCVTSSLIC